MEEGESLEEALIREIHEELNFRLRLFPSNEVMIMILEQLL
ncbi:MAG: NUDIX domain-containing protein [Streptococcus salivarius]